MTRRVISRVAGAADVRADRPDPPGLAHLTTREREVLVLLGRGLSNGEIAAGLVLGEATVKTPVSNVLAKLHLRDRGGPHVGRMLEIRELIKRFGGNTAVDRVSFEVPAGQMTGSVGANGAGKTTTMRMVMGVLGIDGGEVHWRAAPPPGWTGAPSATCRRNAGSTPSSRSSTSSSTSPS